MGPLTMLNVQPHSGFTRRRDLIRFSASRCSSSAFGTRSNPDVIRRNRSKVCSASSSLRGSSSLSGGTAIGLLLHSVRRDQLFVGEATAHCVCSDRQEPAAVRPLAGVEAEHLLIAVAVKVE